MTAAVITPTMVQRRPIVTTLVSGSTERRLMELHLEGPKALVNDWFLLSSYLTSAECANIFSIYLNEDSNAGTYEIMSLETFTYTSANAKLISTGAGTATILYADVIYWTE
jgi:hypothetical protein